MQLLWVDHMELVQAQLSIRERARNPHAGYFHLSALAKLNTQGANCTTLPRQPEQEA